GMGVFLATRAWKYRDAEEKLDRDFDWQRCLYLAAGTSIDTLFLGAGFSFYGLPLSQSLLLAGAVTLITILAALRIGYRFGSGYSRPVAMAGGVLLAGFSIYLLSMFFSMGL
ncbi:MAG: manganese efflux pump, partial [Solobacterium sp.]|nr:manganese efflux pump [Solobacterium sp.]